jgi:hypothetical protein
MNVFCSRQNMSSVVAHQGLRRTAIARLWITRLNQTARRRLAPIGPIRVLTAIAIQDGFHRDDNFLLDPEIPATAHLACG